MHEYGDTLKIDKGLENSLQSLGVVSIGQNYGAICHGSCKVSVIYNKICNCVSWRNYNDKGACNKQPPYHPLI